ncbi:hypothetical protein [Bowmanella pacifica]|uniref:Lipoprotein n=1 Tax=Bowmanella pacifica TaxID=502051 RepID=A0A918DHX6_9ALTE|nr:hypothetical protein [Bowmanella pacifica]GGO67534.1 hypothetical protein GCM10010982_14220 [Bowmanella pacifica]
MNIRIAALLLFLMVLTGCSKPLPEDKLMYAGEWQSREMYLLILPDGTVAYERLKNGGTTSINGPLKEFNGDNFVVGFGPFNSNFEVSEPPHLVDGQWQMVVDGVRLTRSPD